MTSHDSDVSSSTIKASASYEHLFQRVDISKTIISGKCFWTISPIVLGSKKGGKRVACVRC